VAGPGGPRGSFRSRSSSPPPPGRKEPPRPPPRLPNVVLVFADGKWHLGLGRAALPGATPSTATQNQVEWIDYARPVTGGPTAVGFGRFFGIPASQDMPPCVYVVDDRPFFLYLALSSPHTPVVPTPSFAGRTGIGRYGDFVAQTDAAIGEVLGAFAIREGRWKLLLAPGSGGGSEDRGAARGAPRRVQRVRALHADARAAHLVSARGALA
jgi:hypothetical protein